MSGQKRILLNLARRHGLKILLLLAVILFLKTYLVTSLFGFQQVELKNIIGKRELHDWHDYKKEENDASRTGDGEQGKPVKVKQEPTREDIELFAIHGFNAYISDRIPLDRAVPDIRHEDCKKKLYSKKLPSVSVIFIFFNEYFSVLLRSIHSVINRTPTKLLHEIILVDDGSTSESLKEPLDNYIKEHLPKNLVKIVRNQEKMGLMVARLMGARQATAPVLVFFDSHIETNYNWLPPLLEPLMENSRTVTLPLIDNISYENFKYQAQDEGARGVFDWKMDFKRLPIIEQLKKNPTKPFEAPIMAGGLFVITREFFWHIGGYDPGLILWGAEQYELSFKIWMCGGRMLEVPCSRIGHIYRLHGFSHEEPHVEHYVEYNIKRVAEVWMDEYKDVIYKFNKKGIYEMLDVGDLSTQKELRKKLNCKSFDWFLKEIAPDILHFYPTEWPTPYAEGIIQSLANPKLCLEATKNEAGQRVVLATCSKNLDKPIETQYFELSHFRDLRLHHTQYCVESMGIDLIAPIELVDCHQPNNSIWYYDRMNFWIRMHYKGIFCLEAVPRRNAVRVALCDKQNRQLRWHIGNVNHSALNQFNFN